MFSKDAHHYPHSVQTSGKQKTNGSLALSPLPSLLSILFLKYPFVLINALIIGRSLLETDVGSQLECTEYKLHEVSMSNTLSRLTFLKYI